METRLAGRPGEIAQNVPGLQLRNGTTKRIFREAIWPFLPQDLQVITDDLLSEKVLGDRGWFEPKAARKLVGQHRGRQEDWSLQIWQFITLKLWMRTFLDSSPDASAT